MVIEVGDTENGSFREFNSGSVVTRESHVPRWSFGTRPNPKDDVHGDARQNWKTRKSFVSRSGEESTRVGGDLTLGVFSSVRERGDRDSVRDTFSSSTGDVRGGCLGVLGPESKRPSGFSPPRKGELGVWWAGAQNGFCQKGTLTRLPLGGPNLFAGVVLHLPSLTLLLFLDCSNFVHKFYVKYFTN